MFEDVTKYFNINTFLQYTTDNLLELEQLIQMCDINFNFVNY